MNKQHFKNLLAQYRAAPTEFQATSYWKAYEDDLIQTVLDIEFDDLYAGKSKALRAFGFTNTAEHRKYTPLRKALMKLIGVRERYVAPYSVSRQFVEEVAFRYCSLYGESLGARPLSSIGASDVAGMGGLFKVGDFNYTISFLTYYTRYCFVQQHASLEGAPVIVELGSGSGLQVEVLKKLYPDITILCFDMPSQIFLCENYLASVFGADQIVSTETTINWSDLSQVEHGKINFLGNWQMPLLKDYEFDGFWNATSFQEMEPAIVANYLSYVKGQAKWVYLSQYRHGHKTSGDNHVAEPITLEMYKAMLADYALTAEGVFYAPYFSPLPDHFEAVWHAAS